MSWSISCPVEYKVYANIVISSVFSDINILEYKVYPNLSINSVLEWY